MILTLHPDCRPCNVTPTGAEVGIADLPDALHQLRMVYSDSRLLPTLGALEIVAMPGAEHALQAVHNRMASFLADMGNSISDCWLGAKQAIQNLATMEHEPKQDSVKGTYTGTVLCVASGPSTEKWLPRIRELQDQCVIVCADSMWKGLRAAGIDPHFVVVLERDPLLQSLVTPDPNSRAVLVCPAMTYPPTVAGWEGRRVWYWQSYTDLYRWLGPDIPQEMSGRSAGVMAVSFSLLLGSDEVCLIGHDLSRGPDGASHTASVDRLASTTHAQEAGRKTPMHMDIEVEGHRTCPFWELVRRDIATLAVEHPGRLIRAGNDGLDIHGVVRGDPSPSLGLLGPYSLLSCGPAKPSRPPTDILGMVRHDKARFATKYAPRISEEIETGTEASIAKALAMLLPKTWGNGGLVDLYLYILGPAYRAASLRAYLRSHPAKTLAEATAINVEAHQSAARILLRAIPPTLAMMERDLCALSAPQSCAATST